MLKNTKITFVGPGAMAEAMIRGLLVKELLPASKIIASGLRAVRNDELKSKYSIGTTVNSQEAVADADVVVLSIKPQMLEGVLKTLDGKIKPTALVLSIIAGAKISVIENGLSHPFVARAMPNTPAQIGEGMSVWTTSKAVSDEQRAQAKAILGALGEEIFMEDENYLDMATALSGTGPAYVFAFMEAMVDAGVHLGFPRYVSEKLVLQTVKGSVEYAMQSPDHLARLRNQVTSPGGTSAEALYYLDKAGFRTAISRAIWAAYQKSVALGKVKS